MSVFTKAFLAAFKPKPILTVSEWADRNRVLTTETSAVTGNWRTDFTPYLREPMDTCADANYKHIALMFASQTGKSEVLNNVCGFYIDQEPSPQMFVQPTLLTAKEYSQIRISPMIKACPSLADKVIEDTGENRKEKGGKDKPSMYYKPYTGGYLVLSGSNSAASLASKPIRVLLRDEIDRFPYEIAGEGSPLELSEQRTRTFYNRKIVDSSTPLEKGLSKIEDIYEKSDKRNYFVPCPHCEAMQTLDFKINAQWDKDGTDQERSKTARIICAECEGVIKGSGRADSTWLKLGEWRKTADSDIAGFHISALYSPLISLDEIVLKWLEAVHAKSEEKKQVFYNLMLGLPYEKSTAEGVDHQEINKNRRTTYDAELHENILCLTAAVDVQDTWLQAEIKGWSHGNESFGVQHKMFAGNPSEPKVWDELDEWLLTPRYYKNGDSLSVAVTCVDSGGHHTNDVYEFCKARESRNVFAIKGASQADAPLIRQPSLVGKKKDTYLWVIGTGAGKTKVYSSLKNESHGRGYCHYPRESGTGYDEEYFKGLMSEKYVHSFKNGVKSAKWTKFYERNEPLDLFVYNFVALEILKPPYEALQELRDQGKTVSFSAPPTAAAPRRKRVLSKGITL